MEPRPFAFHKMEALVKQMQDPESGVPVRSQKIFLTSIPSAFMGYDLIEWLMDHLNIDESGEAVHLANQLCQYGYLFPVTDCKNLSVKDDNSLYRFQAAYYWPWHHRNPDNVEYAIYLVKRTLRNKQRHALEEYELEALASLKKNLQNKWEIITMQAEEQIKVGKERKKMEKLVADSQERAYWRVHRPPPGSQPPLEPAPISSLRRQTNPPTHNTQVEILRRQVSRSRIKISQAVESLVSYSNTYCEYDPLVTPPQPSNPWLSDDPSFWQFNLPIVEVPTEKRVKRWGLSFEDLLADPSGVEEFTNYLRKEYSHENIRFWLAVKELRHCSQSQVISKVNSIYEEFLAKGAPCEVNIDSKTLETTLNEMKTPSRFTFDVAAHHVYAVLLKKDCYPRFVRSEQYKNLIANALHPPTKKRFFSIIGVGKKKSSCAGPVVSTMAISKRRGSDRSLTGVVHEPVPFAPQHVVPLSSSQANLHEITRDGGVSPERMTVPYADMKQHSIERKQSSEDERVVYEGSSVVEPGPSKNKGCKLEDNVPEEKETEKFKLSIEITEESCPVDSEKTIIKKLHEFEITRENVGSKENVCEIQVSQTAEEPSETVGKLGEKAEESSSSILQSDIVKLDREPVHTEPASEDLKQVSDRETPLLVKLSSEEVEVGEESGKSHKETRKPRKEVRRARLMSEEMRRGSEERKMSEGRKHSLLPESRTKPSVDDEGPSSRQNSAPDSSDAASKTQGSVPQNPADVCPWEDEESCKTEEPFVKKYATLGYL